MLAAPGGAEHTREESQEVTGGTTGSMAASAGRAEKAPGRSQTEVAKMSLRISAWGIPSGMRNLSERNVPNHRQEAFLPI